ncbi:type II toxin-antitoxin system Phd/YefM family antitoxin [Actinophytocola gossypii]|uniref:Antitoxin n=1 Tax=Actinophytocola gossypii TaxID=2812003 RepID=A0ABT2JCL7_9PSEU|nr:type II toxin-antitoxin system prevent-host-death family antitoxin [Actinophytocola gossypii]MCT2585613.1 type II toxin-antitoxin system prevent-host-death family antitoxin [Actinophytocola gossypii]
MAVEDREITQRDLRSRSAEIMDAVEHGGEFTVTRNGHPIGRLVPMPARRTVTREQFAASSANAPLVDAERFRADLDEAADNAFRDPYEQ